MRRKGISFTLTIVVAGVILLMTALSVITLGGSSISDFFGTAGEQQTQALVEQACSDKANQIQDNYCSQYVLTATGQHSEGTECVNSEEDDPTAEESCDSGSAGSTLDPSDDSYSLNRGVSQQESCGDTALRRSVPPNNPTQDGGKPIYDDGGSDAQYYEDTASDIGCEWEGNADEFVGGQIDPTVTVDGNEYNCVTQGHISSTCPVQ